MPDTDVRPTAVIVLAAGAGTRMKSRTPKILHSLGGRSMIEHSLSAARALDPQHLIAVVRHQREKVTAHITAHDPSVLLADQDDVPGTGRAVECALEALAAQGTAAESGTVVVTYGDVPLLTPELLSELVAEHQATGSAVTVLTTELDDPSGYGRVLRSGDEVVGIVEQKDADESQRLVREINSGIYAFEAAALTEALKKVSTDNAQGEKYLTDVLSIARASGRRVSALVTQDRWQVEGANDRVQLQALGAELNRRTILTAMRAGTTVIDPATTWVDSTVTLGEDTTLLPGTQLHGSTQISRDAVIGPDSTLRDVTVGEGAQITRTHATGATIGSGSVVGPFSYLRPGTVLGEDGKIGAFYETKNVTVGRGSKLSHLGYAGDATIGEYSNIGCGNITANYDGENKHRTVIGSHVRTSSNTVFVAPVEIGDGAYTGAGAVVRKYVPPGALALSVAPQRNADGWVQAKRPGSAAADAASAAQAADQTRNHEDAPTATDRK
nr:bifunctional UDP-N-acetylglucosamine diphosphorylase/glucosamine-1-phosphate N-acetyltransferase GlmU [Nesterenkonia natronophila]